LKLSPSEWLQGSSELTTEEIEEQIVKRREWLRVKNFIEADNIRDLLSTKGIQLKDIKDPATGERTTTWEVKR
jgi:cysteinyl-tRNA synthetase